MSRLKHIICLLALMSLGLVSIGGGYTDATAMSDCCDPETMQMMQMDDTDHAPAHDCMSDKGCPPGGACCDDVVASAYGLLIGPDGTDFLPTARTLLSYRTELPPRATSTSHIAPPPIA